MRYDVLDEVRVIIGTYGPKHWYERGAQTYASARAAGFNHVYRFHGGCSPSDARNACAMDLSDDTWLLFVDADDTIDEGYGAAARAALLDTPPGTIRVGRLLTPQITYTNRHGQRSDPIHFEGRDIDVMNPCPIGTLIHKSMFDAVGGFWNETAWEDWSLFRRAWLLGAQIVFVPGMVYHAGYSPRGRNSTVRGGPALRDQIRRSHEVWKELR